MLLLRSPSVFFGLIYTTFSIGLLILTFHLGFNPSNYQIQFLIIFPPLNCLFVFLFCLTWTERRFCLSYIPLICLIILFSSSFALTIISSSLLSVSIFLYFNLTFYCFISTFCFLIILSLLIFFLYTQIHKFCFRHCLNQTAKENVRSNPPMIFKPSNNEEFEFLLLSVPFRDRNQLKTIDGDLVQLDLILILNGTEDSMSFDSNVEHRFDRLFYPIENHFIPKSISDFIQFLYGILLDRHQRILIESLGGMGRNAMTVICLTLLNDYINSIHDDEFEQTIVERIFHYPFVFDQSCRVCQKIVQLRKIQKNLLQNPLQNLFVHEFFARLKSPSYMAQIKEIFNIRSRPIDEFHWPTSHV